MSMLVLVEKKRIRATLATFGASIHQTVGRGGYGYGYGLTGLPIPLHHSFRHSLIQVLILSTLCLRVLFRHSKLGSPLASFSNMVSHFLFCFFQEWQIIPPFTLWPWIVLSPPIASMIHQFFSPNKKLINHSILLVFYLN